MNKYLISSELFEEAQTLFPGGVNSPVRAYSSVKSQPIYIQSAKGAYIYSKDNQQYIDYVNSWGAIITQHADPKIIDRIYNQMQQGLSFGTCHESEIQLANKIQAYMPNLEKLRFVNSGTEACMSAIRLARAYTKRNIILKFNGNYHGHADSFLVNAGSGVITLGLPNTPGIPEDITKYTISIEYNNIDLVRQVFAEYSQDIACIIVEPVVGNSGCILPQADFLQELRNICDEYNSLLIFDEVMTGFRVSRGGAQELFNIKPDLTTLGKIIGGGLPIGCYGGKQEVMSLIAPEGAVYQAGTLSGNPVCMTAGIAALEQLDDINIYSEFNTLGSLIKTRLEAFGKTINIPILVQYCGGMFSIFFTDKTAINSLEEVQLTNTELYIQLFQILLNKGIHLPPSPYEACFLNISQNVDIINKTIIAIEEALKEISLQ